MAEQMGQAVGRTHEPPVPRNTVAKMLLDAGKVCMAFHDDAVRGVSAKRVQVDEIWSFTYAK